MHNLMTDDYNVQIDRHDFLFLQLRRSAQTLLHAAEKALQLISVKAAGERDCRVMEFPVGIILAHRVSHGDRRELHVVELILKYFLGQRDVLFGLFVAAYRNYIFHSSKTLTLQRRSA